MVAVETIGDMAERRVLLDMKNIADRKEDDGIVATMAIEITATIKKIPTTSKNFFCALGKRAGAKAKCFLVVALK